MADGIHLRFASGAERQAMERAAARRQRRTEWRVFFTSPPIVATILGAAGVVVAVVFR